MHRGSSRGGKRNTGVPQTHPTVPSPACHILECPEGLAQDVISTIGQAFELRFKQYLKNPPKLVTPHDRSGQGCVGRRKVGGCLRWVLEWGHSPGCCQLLICAVSSQDGRV